jgi:hypothetical protein
MSKKQAPQVTTQQNTVDPMVSRMQSYTMDQTKNILAPYLNSGNNGYGVADFTTDQNTAFAGIRERLGHGGGGITPGDVQSWMNPYQSAVVDATTGRIQRQGDQALNAIRARQAAGSAFGGMGARSALATAETQRNTQQQIADTTAQLMAQGYTQAQATALANHALQGQSLQALLGAGNQQQQLAQTKLDVPLKALTMLQQSTPQQYSSTQTTTTPSTAPSPMQQVLGLAGTLGGAFLGGPMGASIGGSLGGMLGGGLPAAPTYGMAGYGAGIRPTWS